MRPRFRDAYPSLRIPVDGIADGKLPILSFMEGAGLVRFPDQIEVTMFYNDQIVFMAVELKYCERCGGLYTRRSGSRMTFCESCVTAEQNLGFMRKAPVKFDASAERWKQRPALRYLCVTSVAQAEGGLA